MWTALLATNALFFLVSGVADVIRAVEKKSCGFMFGGLIALLWSMANAAAAVLVNAKGQP